MGAGVDVDTLIGDLDSLSSVGLAHARAHGVVIDEHPADKDATDLELALDAAVVAGARSIDLFGGEGGAPGHRLAGTMLITSQRLRGIRMRWHVRDALIEVLRPDTPVSITGPPSAYVSIVPVGDVTGVRTRGLRWRLAGETLPAGSSRGTNNRLDADHGTITIGSGVALVVTEGSHPS